MASHLKRVWHYLPFPCLWQSRFKAGNCRGWPLQVLNSLEYGIIARRFSTVPSPGYCCDGAWPVPCLQLDCGADLVWHVNSFGGISGFRISLCLGRGVATSVRNVKDTWLLNWRHCKLQVCVFVQWPKHNSTNSKTFITLCLLLF